MSVIGKFTKAVKKYRAEADERAEKRLAKARTSAGREKARAKIQQERLKTKREIAQAKTALLKAEAKRRKAVKEVKDIGGGSVYSQIQDFLYPPKTRRKTKRRKTRKTVRRR